MELRGRIRADRARIRRRFALLLSICLALASVTGCAAMSQGKGTTPDQLQAPAQSSAPVSSAPTCGVPPCDKYLSRGDTRTLANTISDHPIASALVLHLAVSLVCGGILCVWGEGFTLAYVDHVSHVAAQNGECLRVHVLPKGHEWQLVSLDATNQRPYCTD